MAHQGFMALQCHIVRRNQARVLGEPDGLEGNGRDFYKLFHHGHLLPGYGT
ncbi:hypothetical protein F180042I2_36980 [Enterocloster bolteae]